VFARYFFGARFGRIEAATLRAGPGRTFGFALAAGARP
jgi:hypothetical protein